MAPEAPQSYIDPHPLTEVPHSLRVRWSPPGEWDCSQTKEMGMALPQLRISEPSTIRGFLAPHTFDTGGYGRAGLGAAANDNLRHVIPGSPWGHRPVMTNVPRFSPRALIYSQIEDRLLNTVVYGYAQLLTGISYIGRPSVALSAGWHLAADCGNGPGNFMGSFADPIYCGPLPGAPSPGGILEDPTSYNIKYYKFHDDIAPLGEWRFHELWSAVKWDGVTLYPAPDIALEVQSPMPLPDPWPWNVGWRAARHQVGWSYRLDEAPYALRPGHPKIRVGELVKPVDHGVTIVTPTPPVKPKPPGKGRKEVKLSLGGGWKSLGWAVLNGITEAVDFVQALEKGLPPALRAKPVWVSGGSEWNWTRNVSGRWHKELGSYRAPTPLEAAEAIYRHWDQINWTNAIGAVAQNEAVDRLYGRIGRAMRKANRRAGRPLGYQAGPWDTAGATNSLRF